MTNQLNEAVAIARDRLDNDSDAYADQDIIAMLVEAIGFKIETPEGMTYTPWTDGHAVGFKCEQGGDVEYLYLNPSSETDDGQPNVFVYHGDAGDPSQDGSCHFYDVGAEVASQ